VANHTAQAHGGALEHVRGEVLLIAWPNAGAQCVTAAIDTAQALMAELLPMLRQNETRRSPLGVQAAIESGAFLLGVAGPQASRRTLLLGPVAAAVLAMLPLRGDPAAPVLIGAQAAHTLAGQNLVLIGQFLLLDHAQPQSLYRPAP